MGLLEPHARHGGGDGAAVAPVVVVHDLSHARAALAAAAAAGAPVTLLSPAGAAAYWGALYFHALIRLAAEAHPAVAFTAVLDCGERPGDVLAALRQGIADVVFHGDGEVREKLAAIAAARGARLHAPMPADLDLGRARDPEAACRQAFAAGLC
jgi:fructose/tagatose bisphosphate aldolase